MRNRFLFLLFIGFCFLLFVSCNKTDSRQTFSDYYIASPEKMIAMPGEDWNQVKTKLEGKKGYWYSEFPQSQNLAVKAAVSLQAIEESQPNIHYFMLLNISRQTNRIIASSLAAEDSLTTLTESEANGLLLKYYQQGLLPISDTASTYGNYFSQVDGTQVTTTVANVLNKVKAGSSSSIYNIDYRTLNGAYYSILALQDTATGKYYFHFDGYK